jgi:DNA repair ATPase RecN
MSDVLGKRQTERHDNADEHIKTETMLHTVLASIKQMDTKVTAQEQSQQPLAAAVQHLGEQMVEVVAVVSELKGVAATVKLDGLQLQLAKTPLVLQCLKHWSAP